MHCQEYTAEVWSGQSHRNSFDGGGLQFAIALDNRSFAINSVEFQRDKKNNRYLLFVRSDADVEEIRRKEKEQQIAQVTQQ